MKKHTKYLTLILSPIVISGCQTVPTLPLFGSEDAQRIEQVLLNREESIIPPFETRYVQPNKQKGQCEILVSHSVSEEPGYELYWDGKCKDGRAYGLGRVIQKSDLNHYETITVFDVDHEKGGRLSASRDFVNHRYTYGASTSPNSDTGIQTTGLYQHIQSNAHQFNMVSQYGVFGRDAQYVEGSPFHQAVNYVDRKGTRIRYKFTDRSNMPQETTTMSFVLEDPRNKGKTTYAVHSFRQGGVRAYQVSPVASFEVQADELLLSTLNQKMNEIRIVATNASQVAQQALDMEARYLEKICAAPEAGAASANIELDLYAKVCVIKEQQHARYQETMEQVVAHAQRVYEQQKAEFENQQQLQLQQQHINALQAQANAANRQARAIEQGNRDQMWMHNMNNINNMIQQNNNNLWQMNQQMLNSWSK